MKRIFALSLILCLSYQCAAYALVGFHAHKRYMSVGGGYMFYSARGVNHLSTGAGWPDDTYTVNNISNQAYGAFEMGYVFTRAKKWLPRLSLGANVRYVPSTNITGKVDQYSLPIFENYTYSYDVNLLSLLLVLKADLYRWHDLLPYILLGGGLTNYSASNYTEQAAAGVTPRVNPAFNGGSGNNLTYEVGLGFEYIVLKNLSFSLDYDYLNFGTIDSGVGANYSTLTGTNYDNQLLKHNLSASTVFFAVNYYIG